VKVFRFEVWSVVWEPIAESTVASNGGSRLGIWGGSVK